MQDVTPRDINSRSKLLNTVSKDDACWGSEPSSEHITKIDEISESLVLNICSKRFIPNISLIDISSTPKMSDDLSVYCSPHACKYSNYHNIENYSL